jgi:signal transduction histidine kinase
MALFNLFDNAVKYAFNKNPITIRATDHGRHIAIAMTNIGPHIEPAHIDNIFEPFKRVTFKGAQPMPGTGLGLPVARKIAEVHGGQVTVLSEPFRVGDVIQAETTFTFMIPKGFK